MEKDLFGQGGWFLCLDKSYPVGSMFDMGVGKTGYSFPKALHKFSKKGMTKEGAIDAHLAFVNYVRDIRKKPKNKLAGSSKFW